MVDFNHRLLLIIDGICQQRSGIVVAAEASGSIELNALTSREMQQRIPTSRSNRPEVQVLPEVIPSGPA
jgi:hypothetical protein